ncbi:MAG: ABC transporter permease [Isosphaeraceae bacterium]|nr:ABC transporter permease [Isosphaeraceae bacterium]
MPIAGRAHDIPNAQVDRSIQVTVRPGRLAIDYEVSLAELTLVRDLRGLVETLPAGSPSDLFDLYGRVTGPMNAMGFHVAVEGRPIEPVMRGFDLKVEEHPRYTFHFEATLPPQGRLVVQDNNFAGSEGTSRLAVRGAGGVVLKGDDLPGDVRSIAIRPVWQLSDVEERRTKRVEVDYETTTRPSAREDATAERVLPPPTRPTSEKGRLSWLLDRAAGLSLWGMGGLAFGIGAVHAFQPGHGKTLVAATAVEGSRRTARAAVLALVITLTHTGSVLLVAAALWWAQTTRYGDIHVALTRAAGFVIAAIGLWRLGRHLGGYGEHDGVEGRPALRGGLIGLGVAGGIVPCWDAVGLVVLAEAVGRLALGVMLLLAFGLGMAVVLVGVGMVAARLTAWGLSPDREGRWERRLGVASGLVLTGIGLYFLAQ